MSDNCARTWITTRYAVAGFVACLGALGCETPAGPRGSDEIEIALSARPEATGILAPIRLTVHATDTAGEPVADARIDWAVVSGGGFIGRWTNLWGPLEAAETGISFTDSTGRAATTWGLGPIPGPQVVEIRAAGGEPVVLQVDANPGIVLVGVWRIAAHHDPLPSDTFRIHATGLTSVEITEAQGWLDAGSRVGLRAAYVRAGSGIDTTWIFHLDQSYVRLTDQTFGSIPECISAPPVTEESLTWYLDQSLWSTLCPWSLDVVGIEDVPAEYLETLAGG